MSHEFIPLPQNPNWCASYGCTKDKEYHTDEEIDLAYEEWQEPDQDDLEAWENID